MRVVRYVDMVVFAADCVESRSVSQTDTVQRPHRPCPTAQSDTVQWKTVPSLPHCAILARFETEPGAGFDCFKTYLGNLY